MQRNAATRYLVLGLKEMVPLLGEPVLVMVFEVLLVGVWATLFDEGVVALVRISESVVLVERLV